MNRFDFLHDGQRPLLTRDAVRPALGACVALAVAAGAACVESARFAATIRAEQRAQVAFARSSASVARLRVRYRALRDLARTAGEVQRIRSSGLQAAGRFAEIARRLPAGMALNSLRHESGAVVLSGIAVDGRTLADALESLSRSRAVSAVVLVDATRNERGGGWRYEVRAADSARE